MFTNFSSDFDSSSSCSTASPAGDTHAYNQHSPADSLSNESASPNDNTQDFSTETDVSPVVPNVTTISITPESQWMVQPATFPPASASLSGAQSRKEPSATRTTPKAGGSKGKSSSRRGKNEQLSPEEEERKRVRRERNKIAAAKCRNRRRQLTDTLQAETDKLEEDKASLEAEISSLLKEKEQLELILVAHKPACKISDDLEGIFLEPMDSPQPLSALESPRLSVAETPALQDLDSPGFLPATTAISGNSNILLCSSAEANLCDLEPSLDVKDEPMDDVLPDVGRIAADTARSVPDIDLSGPLGVADWETLYKSVAGDLEPLSTPVVTITPNCTAYLSSFAFTYPEFDSLADGAETPKGGVGKFDLAIDVLNSPTLLAL